MCAPAHAAVGAVANTFNIPGVQDFCLFFKASAPALPHGPTAPAQRGRNIRNVHPLANASQRSQQPQRNDTMNPTVAPCHPTAVTASSHLQLLRSPKQEVPDAVRFRREVSERFERATLPGTSPELAKELLTFVFVGAGPTGAQPSRAGEREEGSPRRSHHARAHPPRALPSLLILPPPPSPTSTSFLRR